MPRPTDVNDHATAESRSNGGKARAAKIRERRRTLEDRLSEKLDQEVDAVVGVFFDALEAEYAVVDNDGNATMFPAHGLRLRAARDVIHEAYGRPAQKVELTGEDGGPVELEHRGVSVHDVFAVLKDAGVLSAEGNGS